MLDFLVFVSIIVLLCKCVLENIICVLQLFCAVCVGTTDILSEAPHRPVRRAQAIEVVDSDNDEDEGGDVEELLQSDIRWYDILLCGITGHTLFS